MTQETTERVAVVTGGSRGIGRAVVESLLKENWRVFFCSRSEDSVRQTVEELKQRYPDRVAGHATDVRVESEVRDFVKHVVGETGRIDCLVNNAGLGKFAPVDDLTVEDWDLVIDTNLNGSFYAIRAVAPVMKRREDGWIINIASLASRNPFAGGAAYNASKFGMLGLSDAAMLDLRPHGIRVVAILPGSVDTEFIPGKTAGDAPWALAAEDISRAVTDLLRYPSRALPSRIEMRPSRPPSA